MSNDKNSCQENCKAVPGSGDQSLEISWAKLNLRWIMMNNDGQWWTMMNNDEQWWTMINNHEQWWTMKTKKKKWKN